MAESFREFYERTRGIPFPGHQDELLHVVVQRVTAAMADWCDELANRQIREYRSEPVLLADYPPVPGRKDQ